MVTKPLPRVEHVHNEQSGKRIPVRVRVYLLMRQHNKKKNISEVISPEQYKVNWGETKYHLFRLGTDRDLDMIEGIKEFLLKILIQPKF